MFDYILYGENQDVYLSMSDYPLGDYMILNLIRQFFRDVTRLNQGIEFSPMIATLFFLIGSVNFVAPGFWRSVGKLKWRNGMYICGRAFIVFLLYHFIWIPLNVQISCLVKLTFHGSDRVAAIVSVNIALLYLLASYLTMTSRRRKQPKSWMMIPAKYWSKYRGQSEMRTTKSPTDGNRSKSRDRSSEKSQPRSRSPNLKNRTSTRTPPKTPISKPKTPISTPNTPISSILPTMPDMFNFNLTTSPPKRTPTQKRRGDDDFTIVNHYELRALPHRAFTRDALPHRVTFDETTYYQK